MSPYDHPQYFAFIDTIRKSPEDDLPRLLCADWLEEQGEDIEAIKIREEVQCKMTLHGMASRLTESMLRIPAGSQCSTERGFVNAARLSADDWVRHADEIIKRNPIRKVVITTPLHQLPEFWPGVYASPGVDFRRHSTQTKWPGIEFRYERQEFSSRPDRIRQPATGTPLPCFGGPRNGLTMPYSGSPVILVVELLDPTFRAIDFIGTVSPADVSVTQHQYRLDRISWHSNGEMTDAYYWQHEGSERPNQSEMMAIVRMATVR